MKERTKTSLERASDRLTNWIGSPSSIVVHTVFFVGVFALRLLDFELDSILLILTTAVSLEAIYLAIFIQMTVNRNTRSLEEVEEDIEEISEDVEDISEDIEEISEDIEELGEDVEGLGEGLEEISEDVDELTEDLDKIQAEEEADARKDTETRSSIDNIESSLQKLVAEIETLKKSIRKQ